MRIRASHILILLLALVLAVSCRKTKLIPRKEFTGIVYEMLLRDQQLKLDRRGTNPGDTTLVYEGIFEAHGYDTDDYLYSVQHYLRDPERFSRVFRDVAARMEKEKRQVERQIEARDWKLKYSNLTHMTIDSLESMIYPDTLHIGNVRAVQHPETMEVRFMLEGDDSLFLATDFSPFAIKYRETEPEEETLDKDE